MKKEIFIGVCSAIIASIITVFFAKANDHLAEYEIQRIADKLVVNESFLKVLLDKFAVDKRFRGRDGKDGINFPIGTIIITYNSGGKNENLGNSFLLCNGQEITKDAYPDLFGHLTKTRPQLKISETRATVPDLIDKFLMGSDLVSTGDSAGEAEVILVEKNLPEHSHSIDGTLTWQPHKGSIGDGNYSSWVFVHDGKTKIDKNRKPTPIKNIPPYVKVNFYIKAK